MNVALGRVAVVIAARNAGSTLPATLSSLTAQTWRDWSAVVVDDASADTTAAIVEHHRARGTPLQLLRTNDVVGAGAARRLGVAATSSPLVAFLDADDRWHPEYLRSQVGLFATPSVSAAFCWSRYVSSDGRPFWWHAPLRSSYGYSDALWESLPRTCSALMVRRSAIDTYGISDLPCTDWDLPLRILRHQGSRLHCNRRFLVHYTRHPRTLGAQHRVAAATVSAILSEHADHITPRLRAWLWLYAACVALEASDIRATKRYVALAGPAWTRCLLGRRGLRLGRAALRAMWRRSVPRPQEDSGQSEEESATQRMDER